MKAIVIQQHGGIEQLQVQELAAPVARPGWAVIRPAFVALNHLDLWVRKGVPGHRFPLPIVPGCDFAGTVEQVFDADTHIKVGDRVAVAPGFADPNSPEALMGLDHLARDYGIFGETRHGGCAELVDVPLRNLLLVPPGMELMRAAAFPLAFLTAWGLLVRRAELRAGDDILIHAAGSGVSVACLQIAKLLQARRIIVTSTSDEKLRRACELGAHIGIHSGKQDVLQAVRQTTGKRGVDVVVDHVGGAMIETSLACLAKGGRLVSCGSTSGGEATINLRRLFFKSLSICGSTMGPIGDFVKLWQLHCDDKLVPVIDRVFALREIGAAHAHLESRKAFGKVMVELDRW